MSIKSNITGLLKMEYQQQGYTLMSDDHFYELHIPGQNVPKIFTKHGRISMEDIARFIEEQQGELI